MGLAWILIACFSITRRAKTLPPFTISHWCVIVPNGTFASLSVQLSTVLNSSFFRAFGALWTCIVLVLWAGMFMRSIPALIDGSIFKPVSLVPKADDRSSDKAPAIVVERTHDEEKCIISPKALEALEERCLKDIRIVTDVSG